MQKEAQHKLLALARSVTYSHLGCIGGYLDWVPPGGTVVFGWSVLGGGTGVNSDLGAEPLSAEGLVIGGPSTTCEQDYMTSSRVLIPYTSALTTSVLPDRKRLARAPEWERSEFTITNKLAMVLKVIPWILLKRRRA